METISTVSMVEEHNDLFEGIHKAETREEISSLYQGVKSFKDNYSEIDSESTDRICNQYSEKLNKMLETNEEIYQEYSQELEEVKNSQYSFKGEKDDTQAVNSKLLQLLAQMPKYVTQANESLIRNNLVKEVKSGIIGSKAVLQLLNYSTYAGLLTPDIKTKALNSSKSEKQLKFEANKEKTEKKVSSVVSKAFMRGYHLRNLAEKVNADNKISNWNNPINK
ncbi:hypothetical protein [Acetobacterium sp.]|uniref:hypothetical protein n=1 Tax=Acetobacterium sp. TaxID=1872094 RepID=UPI002F41F6B1